jgi:acetoin:2,6-dichlorophenolindophenol oxidoreductase subunit beta
MRTLTYAAALDTAMVEEMRRDERVFTMMTSPPGNLLAEFGPARVRRTPISESALTGIAVGAAGSGYRPVVNWRSVTFSFVAMDQVVNQACKIRYMFGGQRDFPIVFRAYFMNGSRSAAQHSQTGYAMYAHLAGLKIVMPSSASDALGLLKSAIRDNNPVVCFEASRIDPIAEEVPDGDHLVPIGTAAVKREGSDVTIVGLAYMVHLALEAAEGLAREGISAEVVDPRTLVPLDVETIRASVRKTGRLVVVDESPPTCSMAAEIAAAVVEDPATFRALRGPVTRVCAAAVPVPYSPPLEDFVLPNTERIAAAARALVTS